MGLITVGKVKSIHFSKIMNHCIKFSLLSFKTYLLKGAHPCGPCSESVFHLSTDNGMNEDIQNCFPLLLGNCKCMHFLTLHDLMGYSDQ